MGMKHVHFAEIEDYRFGYPRFTVTDAVALFILCLRRGSYDKVPFTLPRTASGTYRQKIVSRQLGTKTNFNPYGVDKFQ